MDISLKKAIMLGGLLLGCALTSLGVSLWGESKEKESVILADKKLAAAPQIVKTKKNAQQLFKVYISGAVLRPGLYEVAKGTRADEAIALAGGMTSVADLEKVNLAQRLKDGSHIKVPKLKQGSVGIKVRNTKLMLTKEDDTSNLGLININTASARELQTLPGIGPAMAKKIIAYRQQKSFTTIDELVKVPGLGKSRVLSLKTRICV